MLLSRTNQELRAYQRYIFGNTRAVGLSLSCLSLSLPPPSPLFGALPVSVFIVRADKGRCPSRCKEPSSNQASLTKTTSLNQPHWCRLHRASWNVGHRSTSIQLETLDKSTWCMLLFSTLICGIRGLTIEAAQHLREPVHTLSLGRLFQGWSSFPCVADVNRSSGFLDHELCACCAVCQYEDSCSLDVPRVVLATCGTPSWPLRHSTGHAVNYIVDMPDQPQPKHPQQPKPPDLKSFALRVAHTRRMVHTQLHGRLPSVAFPRQGG